MGKEATLWAWFIGGMRGGNPGLALRMRIDRVENVVVVGMPDVSYTIDRADGWIENKAVELPKRQSTRVLGPKGLSVEQIAWHRYNYQCGGRSWVLIHARPWRWLVHSRHVVDEINEMSVVDLTFRSTWHTHMPKMNIAEWQKLCGALQGDGERVCE